MKTEPVNPFPPDFFERYGRCFNLPRLLVVCLILERGAGKPTPIKHREIARSLNLSVNATKAAIDWLAALKVLRLERKHRRMEYFVDLEILETLVPRQLPAPTIGGKYKQSDFGHIPNRVILAKDLQEKYELGSRELLIEDSSDAELKAISAHFAEKGDRAEQSARERYQRIVKEIEALRARVKARSDEAGEPVNVKTTLRLDLKAKKASA